MNWYRKRTWSKADEAAFYGKLGRARKWSRAQYLKIQGIELLEAYDDSLLCAAEGLLLQVLNDYPDNLFERAATLHVLADLELRRNDQVRALDYLERTLDTERLFPQVKTQAYLDYSELVVKRKLVERYEAVENLLKERATMIMFPVEKYKAYSILSIICAFEGKEALASQYATLAHQNATAETSGFRYHRSLGLVEKRDDELDRMTGNDLHDS